MRSLPEINRRSLLIVAAATLAIAILAVIIVIIASAGGGEPDSLPPFTYTSQAPQEAPAAAPAGDTGTVGAPRGPMPGVEDLMLPPANRAVTDWTWRPHVPIGEAWPEELIRRHWYDPQTVAEENLEDMNESLIRSILGVSE